MPHEKTVWSLGYAGRNGLKIASNNGKTIQIKARKIGNMYAPDEKEFAEKFAANLGESDIVVTPSGSNNLYLQICYQRGAQVEWIHPGTLAALQKTGIGPLPDGLFDLYAAKRDAFYEYLPTDQGIGLLRLKTQDWMAMERLLTRDSNALAQNFRRQSSMLFYQPDLRKWAGGFVDMIMRRFTRSLSSWGSVRLSKSDVEQMRQSVEEKVLALYGRYFSEEGNQAKADKLKLIEERLAFFGCKDELDYLEKEVRELVVTLPENHLFDGLISEGTYRARALILSYVQNPLRYVNVRPLLAYAGLSLIDGQAIQRRRGQPVVGHPRLRQAVCFDFADRYWQNDTIGIFERLYYAYKEHQYYMYWDMAELTADVFRYLGKQEMEDDEIADADTDDLNLSGSASMITHFVDRLRSLSHLPIIANSEPAQRAIEQLRSNPDPKLLWRLFARGKVGNGYGLNLQITRKRMEAQTKRMLGETLLKTVYYRWLAQLNAPRPFADDFIYCRQYKAVHHIADIPREYDPEVVVSFYGLRAGEVRSKRKMPLPIDVDFKLVRPDDRAGFLHELSVPNLQKVFKGLTRDEAAKYGKLLSPAHQQVLGLVA